MKRQIAFSVGIFGFHKSFLVSALIILGVSGVSSAANLAPEFRDLLNGTAFIRYIKVAVPGEMYQINGKIGKGWVYYEGSFQGETFWIRNCTNSIPGSGPMLPGSTIGVSSHDNWYTKTNGYIARSPKVGTAKEPTDKLVSGSLAMMSCAFGLGVPIKFGSLKLSEDNSYSALSGDDNIINGHFIVFQNGRPKQCEFASPAYPEVSFTVIYEYSSKEDNSQIPSGFTLSEKVSKDETIQLQFQIIDCQLGKEDFSSEGFMPELVNSNLVLPPQSIFNNQMIFSNGGMYQKQPNGKLVKVNGPNPSELHNITRWLLLILPNCLLLVWLIIRARGKTKSADKN